MTETIAFGGSAADPPHLGHYDLIELLLNYGGFDKLVWLPSGERKDKKTLIHPDHRVIMTLLTFPLSWLYSKKTSFLINFQDVYGVNRPTIYWLRNMREENPEAEIIWYTGVDSVIPRFEGRCEIETSWVEGERLMREEKFCILPRANYVHPSKLTLPDQFYILDGDLPNISSTDIRHRIISGEPFEHLVTPEVANYIKRFRLYGWKGGK